MLSFNFTKMQGLGNDFILFDGRDQSHLLRDLMHPQRLQRLANRRFGIGGDQIIFMMPAQMEHACVQLHIFNADGTPAEACGNGTRCVAAFLGQGEIVMESQGHLLKALVKDAQNITVNMGKPRFGWQDIPASRPIDTQKVEINLAQIHPKGAAIYNGVKPVAVNIGNPHLVFFVEDMEKADIETLGPLLENDPLFPERINVGFVQILPHQVLLLRVWERGTGITLACGTGACAALIAAYYSHRMDTIFPRKALVKQQGGDLEVEWTKEGSILMTGPAQMTFKGTITL